MRRSIVVLALIVGMSCGMAGCSTSGDDLALGSIESMNELSDGFDQGDIVKIRSAVVRFKDLRQKAKNIKLPASEDKRLQEKHKSALEAARDRLMVSMSNALGSDKFSADQKKEIGGLLSDLN